MTSDEKKNINDKYSRELLDLLNDVDELDWLEAKSLRDDTSRSILETVCSLSNEPGLGGGVILIGVAETKGSGIDRMWRKMVEAGLSRPTMESDRSASTFTIRLLLCHFFSEEMLDWLKQFASYELNDNQRTALVFLREVGALDAVAYRQLTGCNPKLVARELAGIKDQGLTIQRGRARGTYYVPSEKLLMSTPQPANTTPLGANTTPSASNTIPLPKDIEEDLAKLKGKAPAEVLSSLIVRLCSCRPMTNEMLQTYLKRGKVTINKLMTPLVGKRIDYLFPMMPHHPNQAYVASTGTEQGLPPRKFEDTESQTSLCL